MNDMPASTLAAQAPFLRRFAALGCILALLGATAACSSKEKPVADCPAGIIPADAASVTRFRDGAGRDLTDVVAEAEIVNILVQCKYDSKGVTVDLQVAIAGSRGPADRSRKADFDYFVAILDPQQNVVQKQPFRVNFEFADNRTRLGVVEELEPRVPLSSAFEGPKYQLLVGFQLTPDELAWNRSQRSKQ